MAILSPLRSKIAAALALLVALLLPGACGGDEFDWGRPDTTGLARMRPEVEPEADAEDLVHYVRVTDVRDADLWASYDHYIRRKIYTPRGAQDHSNVRLRYARDFAIEDVRARTIAPDGTVTPVDAKSIYRREALRAGKEREHEVTFTFPAVVPGSILEYRYRESMRGASHGLVLRFAADLPVVRSVWDVKPLHVPGVQMPMMQRRFGEGLSPFVAVGGGYHRTEARRLRARRTEPWMPGRYLVEPWILIYYELPSIDRLHYWRDVSRNLHRSGESLLRLSREDAAMVAREIETASTPLERLQRLYRRCRAAVRVLDPAKKEPHPRADAGASDVLAFGAGSPEQVNQVFAAMCRAAAFDVRIALVSDRQIPTPPADLFDTWFYPKRAVAVALPDGSWIFADPGDRFLEFGRLRWQQEGVLALLEDPREPRWLMTPLSAPSLTTRHATFQVDAAGVVEGDLRVACSGHSAVARRVELDGMSEKERAQTLEKEITERLPGAEISGVVVEGLGETEKPLVMRCHLRLADFAAVTGQQVTLQPELLVRSPMPGFTASVREYPIEMPYAFTERDSIRIDAAEGLSVAAAEAPAPLRAPGLAEYAVAATGSADGRSLSVAREMTFGLDGLLSFPVSSYGPLRDFFRIVAQRDEFPATFMVPVASK